VQEETGEKKNAGRKEDREELKINRVVQVNLREKREERWIVSFPSLVSATGKKFLLSYPCCREEGEESQIADSLSIENQRPLQIKKKEDSASCREGKDKKGQWTFTSGDIAGRRIKRKGPRVQEATGFVGKDAKQRGLIDDHGWGTGENRLVKCGPLKKGNRVKSIYTVRMLTGPLGGNKTTGNASVIGL